MQQTAAFGSDEKNELTDFLLAELERRGCAVVALCLGEDWPVVGYAVASAVANSQADFGIVCCYTGTGVSIAANKVAGVRAALCSDAVTAAGARRWNNANVLALSLRTVTKEIAREILDAWMTAECPARELELLSKYATLLR